MKIIDGRIVLDKADVNLGITQNAEFWKELQALKDALPEAKPDIKPTNDSDEA